MFVQGRWLNGLVKCRCNHFKCMQSCGYVVRQVFCKTPSNIPLLKGWFFMYKIGQLQNEIMATLRI